MTNSSSTTHRSAQHSTTLNRKYVKRPAAASTTAKSTTISSTAKARSEALKRRQALAAKINQENLKNLKSRHTLATKPTKATTDTPPQPSEDTAPRHPDNTKSAKIPDPRRSSLKTTKGSVIDSALKATNSINKKSSPTPKLKNRSFFSFKRILLAFGCAAAAVAVIAYFVNLSIPDISARVTALQTGIDASVPDFIPRDYSLSSIVSEEGKISMSFETSSTKRFTITQEKSSWDSAALESNYVAEKLPDYSVIRENGITLYVSGSDCAWVNGGKFFTIKDEGANLSKKQLQSIAKSLQ